MSDFMKKARKAVEDLGLRPRRETLEIYYLSDGEKYCRKLSNGSYVVENLSAVRRFLRLAGFSSCKGDERISEVDDILSEVHEKKIIAGVLKSGVLEPGLYYLENKERVVVTRGPEKVEPVQGDFSVFASLVKSLLGEEQQIHFYGLLQNKVLSLYKGLHHSSQALFLIGKPKGGKSLLQNMISKILGNRQANPLAWLTGTNKFNSELFGAIHLRMDSEFLAAGSKREKIILDALLNKIVDVDLQPVFQKYGSSFSIAPHWQPSASLNCEPRCLACLPELTGDNLNRLQVYYCTPINFVTLRDRFGIMEDREALDLALSLEVPAIVWHLLNGFSLPPELQDEHCHVRGYVSPVVEELCWRFSDEHTVFEALKQIHLGKNLSKSEYEIGRALEESGIHNVVGSYLRQGRNWTTFLSAMSRRFPAQIQPRQNNEWQLDFR